MSSNNNPAPVDAHAVSLITALAQEAATPMIAAVDTAGLGEGLPPKVQVGFDRKSQKFFSIHSLIEEARQAPKRRRGTAVAGTLASFIALVNRHKDDQSALFGQTGYPNPKLTAVLNYDSAESAARHGDHRIDYAFPLTEEFKAWVNGNAKPMGQAEFAMFLEEHSAELAAPEDGEKSLYERLFREKFATPSEVIELSRYLDVHVAARVKQGIRLQTGEKMLEFSEEHQNAAGEKVVIPGVFMLSVPAFVDGDAVRIPARLRYRITSGAISWHYQLYRWESFLRETVEHALLDAARETGLPAYDGAPESGKAG